MSPTSEDLKALAVIEKRSNTRKKEVIGLLGESSHLPLTSYFFHQADFETLVLIARHPWKDEKTFEMAFAEMSALVKEWQRMDDKSKAKADELLFNLALNDWLPVSALDRYAESGSVSQQLALFESNARADRLTDSQWAMLASSKHREVRRKLAKQYPYLPEEARSVLDADDDYVVVYNVEHAMKRFGDTCPR